MRDLDPHHGGVKQRLKAAAAHRAALNSTAPLGLAPIDLCGPPGENMVMLHFVCPRRSAGFRRGFTIIELLVIISIISLLISLLLPVLGNVRVVAMRSKCASHLRNWGQGLRAYASSNNKAFPYNGDATAEVPVGGRHCSWVSDTVVNFRDQYLIAFDGNSPSQRENPDNVSFCPTQQWHRVAGSPNGPQYLLGYFYLPHRNPNNVDYTPAGRGWVARKEFDGPFGDAPIMMDMKQWNSNPSQHWRLSSGVPWSSHVTRSDGQPDGGNFLFEDGRVVWYLNDEIENGANIGAGWKCYYKVQLD